MSPSTSSARSLLGLVPMHFLVVAALVVACGSEVPPSDAIPAPSGSAAPTSSGPPSHAPSPSDEAPAPTASPATPLAALIPGELAVTVTDGLRVRSDPSVGDESVKYVPLLAEGTELVVTGGPVEASGYQWFQVAPLGVELRGGRGRKAAAVDQGWVAIADQDGTPWVAPADDPTPGFDLASATVERAPARRSAAREAALAQNAFGLALYRRMLRDKVLGLDDRSVVMSPTSLMTALGMARAGARGETAAEMDAVLGLDGWDRYPVALGALDQILRARDATWGHRSDQHALALRMANMAFGQQDFAIRPEYLERIGVAFGSPLGLVDYVADPGGARQAINGWVSRQTMGRIPDLLTPSDIRDSTRLTLVNAIYLKAEWAERFDDTRNRPFTTMAGRRTRVPTMSQSGKALPIATGAGWTATELPYLAPGDEGNLSMTLIRPDDIDAFERSLDASVIRALDRELVKEWDRVTRTRPSRDASGGMDCGRVAYYTDLYVPRFGIETRGNLSKALKASGMRLALDPTAADLSGIDGTRDLFIASVIHQANIDVHERGTEAAAATAVGVDVGGCTGPIPDRIRELRFDRPFVFLLRDRETGAILFMGRVADPTKR